MQTRNVILTAVGAVALGYLINRLIQTQREVPVVGTKPSREEDVDMTIDDSFPASDPPSWSSGNIH
ncbi:hypothetical protein DOM22_04895 [Bdellovibrio sp. ZAP7]|uniref:hypothetical protein n=1 Tax=Bdellovibrio sp. ZAP7 TaxID=2231053 RepID=UPI00115C0881|nr:hypothetical protein [Bdellovibrio sp. ZAP7]QDK44541.1 hypothetical protein DOM22_04895 [Bdellovibrio sp. ZAP7]